MTWNRALAASLLLLAGPLAAPLAAQDDIFAITRAVALDEADPGTDSVGDLIYRGGIAIDPGEEEIGGISGLEWHDERLYAVSDDGHWLAIVPDEIGGKLVDIAGLSRGELKDERGRRLRGKDDADAEAIARDPQDGAWIVSFERDHRLWRYADIDGAAEVEVAGLLEGLAYTDANAGIETLAIGPAGALACIESHAPGIANCVRRTGGTSLPFELVPPAALAEHGGAPTDATCAADGTCYVLFRSYRAGEGNRAAIVALAPDNSATTLAVIASPLSLDNFEGIALREEAGTSYLYIVSDNNFSDRQRTLLLKFEIRSDEPQVAATPEPVTQYETVDVVLVTEMGDITIRLETERAPITAANFLRYAAQDRFDGTVFYRAMKLDREPRPNGLIQGGTQYNPKRILPPIAHEPTTQTGLSHTNGAISMAMLEPGSATGDFSIMLADQTGLDAQPASPDPVWQNGYAVFGYVIDGMDVVSAIHAAPADPDKGEGHMRGQMLADPVKIIDVVRLEPAAE